MSIEQRDLIDRCRIVLGDDPRIRGVWLAGSFARHEEDDFSDVDLWVAVDEGDLEAVIGDWPTMCDRITPTVFRQQVGNLPIFNQITADWLRLDVSFGKPDEAANRPRSTHLALHDPSSLTSEMPERGPILQPDPGRVLGLTTEFIRVLGLLPVVVGRNELVVGASGAGLLRTMLIQLALEDVAVEDRGGALHLHRLLPQDRYEDIASLPPIEATSDSVIEAHLAATRLFVPMAEALLRRYDTEFPSAFYDAARLTLMSRLGLELPELSVGS